MEINKYKNDFISCQLNGGLGNQIFQHVLLFWIEENFKKKIIIYKHDYTPIKNFYRKLRKIQPLFFYDWLIENQDIKLNLNIFNRIKVRLNRHFKEIFEGVITNNTFIKYKLSENDAFFREITNAYYLGSNCIYPQLLNYECFNKSWEKIGKLCLQNIEFKNKLYIKNFDIVLHIRKGDYISFGKKRFAYVSKYYYLRSIKYILKRINFTCKPKVLVLGNDLKWAKSFLNDKEIEFNFQFNNEIEDFYYIASCKNLILANSSFSYAAAMVATVTLKDTLITCPSEYYLKNMPIHKFKNKNWVYIDN